MSTLDERDRLGEETGPVVDEHEHANGGPPEGSVLATVLAKREAKLADKYLDVDVPGYGGHLVLRLEPLTPGELSRIAAKAAKAKDGSPEKVAMNSDVLIKACREVLGRIKPDDEPQPLLPGETLRIDSQLAETLEFKATTARGLLLELFGLANDPTIAIANASVEFGEWCGEANTDAAEDLLGESPATRE